MSQIPGSPERLQSTQQPEAPHSRSGEQIVPIADPIEEGKKIVTDKIGHKRQERGNFDSVAKAELRGEYTPVLKQKILEKRGEARDTREVNEKFKQIPGDALNIANNVVRAIAEFAEAARQGIVIPPSHQPSKAVFDILIEQIQGEITPKTASYIWPLVNGLMNEENYIEFSKPNEDPTQLELDLEEMIIGSENDPNEYFVQNIFSEAIERNQIPELTVDIFRERMKDIKNRKRKKIQERSRNDKNPSIAEQEFERTFGDERDPEQREAMELYRAIKSTSPEDFFVYYRSKIDEIIDESREKGITLSTEKAGKKVTEQIHKTLLYMVNTIYATTLAKAPKVDFKATANSLGVGFVNPNNVFNEAVSGKLSRLASNMKSYKGSVDLDFYTYERKTTEYYNEKTKRIEEATVPTANLEKVNVQKFSESLREITEIELGALEYQYNFSLLIQNPPKDQGIFQTIAGYAKQNLKTETIDNLYILPYNEVIQAAVMGLEPMYERLFSKYDWKKSTALQTELFEQLQPAEKKTLDQLHAYFKGNVPSWAITRAFYHARLMSFGKEFKYQLLSSYADPLITDIGDQTYLGESPFASNSVYDIMEGAKRWGEGTDPYILGLPTMPWNKHIGDFHPLELQEEGQRRWKESFTYGDMAYYDNEIFRDKDGKPIISLTNFTKMGGVDAYGGWRVKFAYLHWLNDIVDIRSKDLDLTTNDNQVFVKGWKSVENIGVNVLKNFSESFVLKGVEEGKKIEANESKYKDFFKFLYRRYFKEGIGKAMYEGVNNDEVYWNKIRSELFASKEVTPAMQKEILNKHIYNAMSVILFERMPTEFVFMERRRSSQNGVTLQQELLEEFVGTEQTAGKWKEGNEDQNSIITKKWDVAFDDIIYVQQAARMDSIEKMKQLQSESENSDKLGILYGDLQNDHSEVNYAINEQVIEQKLREKHSEELKNSSTTPERKREIEGQIKRAKELYKAMYEKMKLKPKEGELEKKWKGSDRKKYNEAREWTKKRGEWFADTWRDYGFGMQFTADSAGQFMNRSATGEELISRTAEASQVISEATKNVFASNAFLDGINASVRNGRSEWDKLREPISEVYSSAKQEDGDIAKQITRDLVNWASIALRRDDRYRGDWKKLNAQFGRIQTSLAARKVGEGPAYDWDSQDIFDFVSLFTQKNIIPQYTSEKKMKYKHIPPKGIEKLMAKLTGGKAVGKLVRDYEGELSGEAIRKMHAAGRAEVFERHGLPVIGLAAIALMFILLKKAMEDETE